MIRMKSKYHGYMHALDANDEKRLRAIGWIGEDESFDDPAPINGHPVEPSSEAMAARLAVATTAPAPVPVRRVRAVAQEA